MDVLTFETCWAVNGEIIKQVPSSWSVFIQLLNDARSNNIRLRNHLVMSTTDPDSQVSCERFANWSKGNSGGSAHTGVPRLMRPCVEREEMWNRPTARYRYRYQLTTPPGQAALLLFPQTFLLRVWSPVHTDQKADRSQRNCIHKSSSVPLTFSAWRVYWNARSRERISLTWRTDSHVSLYRD